MLSIAPSATFIDVSHEISPQDVMEAAFVLRGAIDHFPPGAVHLAVVDPGVGTDRNPIALMHRDRFFVGPDNGLFTLVLGDEAPERLVKLDRPQFWRVDEPASTFHGRDVFAPVAAHLSEGRSLDEVGTRLDRLAPLHWALPTIDEHGVQGWVVHVDRFGNCITNISQDSYEELQDNRSFKCFAGSEILNSVHETYGSTAPGEPLLLFNSDRLLEISVNGGNASDLLSIRKGAPVNIVFSSR